MQHVKVYFCLINGFVWYFCAGVDNRTKNFNNTMLVKSRFPRLNSWVVSHSALIIGTLCHALGHQFEPWRWQTFFQTQAQHLCFIHDSIWFDTIICLSNLSCELWNRKLKIKKCFKTLTTGGCKLLFLARKAEFKSCDAPLVRLKDFSEARATNFVIKKVQIYKDNLFSSLARFTFHRNVENNKIFNFLESLSNCIWLAFFSYICACVCIANIRQLDITRLAELNGIRNLCNLYTWIIFNVDAFK